MNDKQFVALTEIIGGLVACQSLLFQFLVANGTLKREEVGLALDELIEKFNKQCPTNNTTTKYIKDIRQSINKASPFQYPDWLRDITDEGDQNKK